MKRIIILALALCLAFPALAQKMTSFSPAKFSFTSEPEGAKVYFEGQLLGTTPFSAEVKPAYRTQGGNEGQSEFEIYAANSAVIEREINDSGKTEGVLSRFSLEFTYIMPDGTEIRKEAKLMWKQVSILGQQGLEIFYPPKQIVKQ